MFQLSAVAAASLLSAQGRDGDVDAIEPTMLEDTPPPPLLEFDS
jgi:hypothetical protein